MLTVLVADIFGKSLVLQQLAKQLTDQETLIIDAYASQIMDFANEQSAYDYFSINVGLNKYALQIQEKLITIKQPFNLIAFSVGGSAVWLNSQQLIKTKAKRVICFYPSQIRHHLELQPSLAIRLILPKSEPHFEISELKTVLSSKKNVKIEHSEYLHGFMNQLSENYNQQGFQQYLTQLSD